VLGANDGIISTSSLVIGIAAASSERMPVVLAALAGMTAGAFSMAAGEYVSVSSQADTEKADLAREQMELATIPEQELKELAGIYRRRGLDKDLAMQVAAQLTRHDALGAHARDELGINEITQAQPLLAALSSFASFAAGALLPVAVALLAPLNTMVAYQYGFAIVFLIILGAISARTGGAPARIAVARVVLWGTAAMGATALVGYIFGVAAV
jgi:VIT1/CCC1 family predicted Fe2+/Mn2+ transporter